MDIPCPEYLQRHKLVYDRHQAGETYTAIAKDLGITPVRTRALASRWQQELDRPAKELNDRLWSPYLKMKANLAIPRYQYGLGRALYFEADAPTYKTRQLDRTLTDYVINVTIEWLDRDARQSAIRSGKEHEQNCHCNVFQLLCVLRTMFPELEITFKDLRVSSPEELTPPPMQA